jgi:gliding motility-associated-like protein
MLLNPKNYLFVFLCFFSVAVVAQNPSIRESLEATSYQGSFFSHSQRVTQAQTLNACNTWTFQLQLSSAASEQPSDAINLPDGNYIICGNDSSASGKNARLLKLNSQGVLLYSKAFSVNNQQFTIQHIRSSANGNLYALGTILEPATGFTRPVLLVVDPASLSLITVLQLDMNGGPANWKGVDLTEMADNNFFLLCYNDSLLNITSISSSNSITWSRTYRPRNSPRPVGIGYDYGDVFVVWNETDSGYSKAVKMSLDQASGNYRFGTRIGGLADGMNFEMHSAQTVNNRPRVTGLEWNNNQYKAVRISFEPPSSNTLVEAFDISGFVPAQGMRSGQDGLAQMLAYQSANALNQVNLVATWPDNLYSPIRSWRVNYSYPVELNRLVATNDDGSLVVCRSTGFPQRIILTKTDSVSTLPGCNVSSQTASLQFFAPALQLDNIPQVPFVFQISPLVITSTDIPVSITEDCKTLYCPDPPKPDSCLRTFFKEYRNYSNSIVARNHVYMGSGKFLVLSSERAFPYEAVDRTEFTVMDTAGRILDVRTLNFPQPIVLITLDKLRDGSFVATGLIQNGSNTSDIYLIKFDSNFSIIWQKKLLAPIGPQFNAIDAITESTEGDLYCYLRDRTAIPGETRTILKLNSSATPVWMQQYLIGPTIFGNSNEFITSLVEFGNNIVFKYNEGGGDYSPFLASIRKTDGSIVWIRKYQMPPPHTGSRSYSLEALISDGTNIFMSGYSQEQNVLLKIRPDGSVGLAKRSPTNSVVLGWMGFKPGGKMLASALAYTTGGSINGVVELDTSFTIHRTQYMKVPRFGRGSSLMPFSDSVTYSTGSLWYDNNYWASIYFQKYNFNSSFARCAVNEQLLTLDSFSQTVTPKTISQAALSLPQMIPLNATISEAYLAYSGFYCGNNTACSSVQLLGPTTICDTSNIYSFSLTRNPGCDGMVLWNMDTLNRQIRIISVTDSLLRLKISSSGTFKLSAKVFANCGWLEDSIKVDASAGNNTLELGQDMSLCPGNSAVLHAGSGFASYQWQDGSTDSVLNVTQPGLYYVQVTSCGNIFRDSIQITASPPISFDAGPDRAKCNNDTLHLNAPSGFLNYTWGNNYNISSANSQNVVVNPLMDTAYYVKAEKTPGCFAYDTVRITVHFSSPVDLGTDRNFCNGDSAVFDAGAGFAQYQWSNGSSNQQITVKTSGALSVIATSLEGCKSFDTVKVLNVFANPVVALNHSNSICVGTTRTLDAGNFSSYLWNNGTSSRTIIVNGIGLYAVEVSDNNGCRGSDTAIITTVLAQPKNFLPPDTSICSYGKIALQSINQYNTYLWSTGGISSSITITQPGLYWLQVKDDNNCVGRDSVLVNPKDCMKGFYIPNAFTPNGDGKNDLFRPLLFGKLVSFDFRIYNRWGQIVFQTSETAKSWDGTYAGITQDSNVFIWTCTYQFEGEEKRTEKGTVMLIR